MGVKMSFLRKLFSKKEQPTNKPSPKHRAPRIHRDVFEDLKLTLKTDAANIKLPIVNISSTGIALEVENQNINGTQFTGIIEIKSNSFLVQLTVIHQTDKVIGCKFTNYPDNFPTSLTQLFRLQFIASAFTEVNKLYLKQAEEGQVHWFVDGESNEIYFIISGDSILQFHIVLGDSYLEGGKGLPRKTGTLSREKTRDLGVKSSRTIQFDPAPNSETLTQAFQLLQYVEHFCDANFKSLKELLAKAP
jgi:hypothetical protein